MKPYIYGKTNKNKIYTLNIEKIVDKCKELKSFISEILDTKEKTILFLSTKKQARELVKEQAKNCNMPYIVNKWKGGFLTNFREIGRKLKELQSLNNFIQKDSFKNLIKKEQASIEKRRNKLLGIYEGVVNIKKQPDALFIIGMNKEKTAFKEAKKLEMPVIAVCNTNCNPKFVDFVIPGNDEGVKSIEFFSKIVSDSIRERNNPESLDKRKENLEKEISK